MSHTTCSDCGARYRDEHECPEDGEMLLDRIRELEARVEALSETVMDLRLRVGSVEGLP
jgi:predicted metal-binding protein